MARAIGQIKSHVQILSGRVWGRARAIARARMTRLNIIVLHVTFYSFLPCQSLMCALAINQPTDGRQYLIDVILKLKNDPEILQTLKW